MRILFGMGAFGRIAAAGALLFFAGGQVCAQEAPQPALGAEPEAAVEQSQANAASKQDTAPEPQGATDLTPALKGIESAVRELIAKPDDAARERQEEREIKDLNAQREMARWALPMFATAVLSVVVTFVGVVLIKRTLHYTREAAAAARDAVTEARRATIEAERGATAAQMTAQAMMETDRAKITFTKMVVELSSSHKDRDIRTVNISYIIRNAGNTLGFMSNVRFCCYIDPKSEFPGTPNYTVGKQKEMRDLIAPMEDLGEKNMVRVENLAVSDLDKIRSGDYSVVVYGVARYRDIYNNGPHRYRFSFIFRFDESREPTRSSVFNTFGTDAYWEYS